MNESRKVTLEQSEGSVTKRIIMEQTETATPKWSALANSIKEGSAENANIFINSFSKSLLPSLLIGIMIFIFMLVVCGR